MPEPVWRSDVMAGSIAEAGINVWIATTQRLGAGILH
jgi:hypothetical protein